MKMPHRNKATFLIVIMLLELLSPLQALALSGGNKAPEFESFQPFGLDNMVDPATGDFSYNIPLMNVGFHGINLFYQAGVTMDQEASMVGLGWNINSGMINRNVRGIPDDFNGDVVKKELNYKPSVTVGLKTGGELEVVGGDMFKLKAGVGVSLNSLKGIGFDWSLAPSFSVAKYNDKDEVKGLGSGAPDTLGFGGTLSLNISSSTHGGMSLSPNVSFDRAKKEGEEKAKKSIFGIGTSINSRAGMKGMNTSLNLNGFEKKKIHLPKFSADISFSKPSFVPYVDFPTTNTAFTFNASYGGAGFTIFGSGYYTGYFTKQTLAQNTLELPAHGLLYPSNYSPTSIQDFHRAHDGPQTKDIPNLPVPQLDYDIYSLAGPGLSGSLQLKRGDLGLVTNRSMYTNSSDLTIGGEVGAGSIVHVGGAITDVSTSTKSKGWENDNNLISSFLFNNSETGVDYEKAFFRKADEYLVEENDKFTKIGAFDAMKPILNKKGLMKYETDTQLKSFSGGLTNFASYDGKNNERIKRNNSITYLTLDEAKEIAFSNYLKSINGATTYYESLANHSHFEVKGHHIAEIAVTNQDGYKYYYGLPVYNITQVEKTFAINNLSDTEHLQAYEKGLIHYGANTDIINNNQGKDHYYSSTTLPPFVTSYLLTSIVSNDYQDRTGDGPTPDDYGDYVRFNYSQADGFYSWRTPYSNTNNLGSHNPGILADREDDKANYIYGERQQFFPKSIESKSEIVVYEYYQKKGNEVDRADGEEASSDQGVIGLNKSKALKRLTKYSLPDYMLKKESAEPLKSVFFEYNYSLCSGIENTTLSGEGKLTLDRLYIINGKSNKGRFSPYVFEYDNNPNYHPKAMNRWGGYQPLYLKSNPSIPNLPDKSKIWYKGGLTTVNFPYVPQDQRIDQDRFAASWNLSTIKLPSGGKIKVNYEADDYSHVQDKRAMQMFEIAGLNSSPTFSSSSNLYSGSTNNNFVFFEIKEEHGINNLITGDNSTADKAVIFSEFIKDIFVKPMYFKIFGHYKFFGLIEDDKDKYEYVPGWTKIKSYGTAINGTTKYGYVELKPASINDREVSNPNKQINPMAKAFMQAIRLNFPEVVWPYGDSPDGDPGLAKQAITALIGTLVNISEFTRGVNKKLKSKGFGETIMKSKSFIRLYNPNKKKVSGSHRVRSIAMSDNWDMMTNNGTAGVYGKRYTYTESEPFLSSTREVSTGVAAYEPAVGGEENCLRMGIDFTEELLLAPDNTKYQEDPLMEDYYPAPRIIYGKVTVNDVYSPSGNMEDKDLEDYENTGYAINEFHTYKDYPIRVQNTTPEPKTSGTPNRKFKLLKIVLIDRLTTAQGYAIHDPQMHGKPKANYNYNSSGQRISGQEFEYLEDDKGRLDYNIRALFSDGQIKDARMGLDYSLFADSREVKSVTEVGGYTGNTEGFPIAFIPGVIPTILPKYAREEKQFRSLVLVKSVRQNGILKSTTTINGPARIKTENILWDAETGNPIVTKTINEFEDAVYQVNLPAHLKYKQMGQAYQNAGAKFNNTSCTNGNLLFGSNSQIKKGLNIGDKLVIYDGPEFGAGDMDGDGVPDNSFYFAWVLYKDNDKAYLIDKDGNPLSFTNKVIKVLESGFNNKAGQPIGSYVTLNVNPAPVDATKLEIQNGIIDASVTTYDDQWQSYCSEQDTLNQMSCECTTANYGIKFLNFLEEKIEGNTVSNGPIPQIIPPLYNQDDNCNYYQYEYKPIWELNKLTFNLGDGDCACNSIVTFSPTIPLVNIDKVNLRANQMKAESCNPYKLIIENVEVIYKDGSASQATMQVASDNCLNFFNCMQVGNSSSNICGISPGYIANPFIHNIKGNWRTEKSYVFQTDRKSSDDIQVDGTYAFVETNYRNPFRNFWDSSYNIDEGNWTWTNESTLVNPLGIAQEAKDPLGRHSAEIVGYNAQKVIAVAANAKLNEIAYTGFEQGILNGIDVSTNQDLYNTLDYDSESETISLASNAPQLDLGCTSNVHFPVKDRTTSRYDNGNMPNSGNASLRLKSGKTIVNEFITSPESKAPFQQTPFTPYVVDKCDCLPKFSPTVNKRYWISAWLKDARLDGSENESGAYLKIELDGQSVEIKTYGPLIEGWRKVEGEFTIAENITVGKIIIENGNRSCYLDDLRIHPYNASMKTYNYDPTTLRFTYEHDDNNFFTRYDYAEDGTLERVSKQTERGVMTLQESTFSQQKKIN